MKMVLKTLSVGELRSPNSTQDNITDSSEESACALLKWNCYCPIVDEHMQIIDGILRFEIAKELGLQELNASDATKAKHCNSNSHLIDWPKTVLGFNFRKRSNHRH